MKGQNSGPNVSEVVQRFHSCALARTCMYFSGTISKGLHVQVTRNYLPRDVNQIQKNATLDLTSVVSASYCELAYVVCSVTVYVDTKQYIMQETPEIFQSDNELQNCTF